MSSYQASTVSVSIPWFLSNTFLNFVICERKQLHKIYKKILWNCGFEIWELLSSDLKKICSQQTIGIKFENNRTIESFEIKLNTLSRSVCQLGRKQEHSRWIRKLTLQLLREWRLIVFGKTFVVNFGAKILGQ